MTPNSSLPQRYQNPFDIPGDDHGPLSSNGRSMSGKSAGDPVGDISNLEQSLRETLRSSGSDSEKRQKALEIQRQAWDQTRQVLSVPKELSMSNEQSKEEELKKTESRLQITEQEIVKRKLEVQKRVKAQVNRVEQEARRLDELRRDLDALEDPTKKEVAELRRRIELVDRDLKPLKALCTRKEKELKDAVALYNVKSSQKTDLVGKLFEIVTESEKQRMGKLEELNAHLQAMESLHTGG